jgi:hypothetical protein
MTEKQNRTAPLGLRLTPTVRAALDKAAAADNRSVASFVERLLIDHLKKMKLLPEPKADDDGNPEGHDPLPDDDDRRWRQLVDTLASIRDARPWGPALASFPLRLQPELDQAFELLSEAPHEPSAIVKPDRDTTIITALADLTAQRHFGFPGECSGNKMNPSAYLEIAISLRGAFIHLSPSARSRFNQLNFEA